MTCFYITIILPYLKKNNYLQFLNIVYKIPDYLENALLHLVLHLNATSLNTFLLPLLILCRGWRLLLEPGASRAHSPPVGPPLPHRIARWTCAHGHWHHHVSTVNSGDRRRRSIIKGISPLPMETATSLYVPTAVEANQWRLEWKRFQHTARGLKDGHVGMRTEGRLVLSHTGCPPGCRDVLRMAGSCWKARKTSCALTPVPVKAESHATGSQNLNRNTKPDLFLLATSG